MPGLSNKAAPHCAIGGPPKSPLYLTPTVRVVHFYWMKLCFLRHRPTVLDNSITSSAQKQLNPHFFEPKSKIPSVY